MKKKKTAKPRDSFTESDKHVLNGIKLFPWTPARLIAAQAMGMLFPDIGKEGWDQYRRTKLYSGAVRDTIICLWLCTIDEDAVDQADAAPLDAYKRARAWATGLGIHDTNKDAFWQAYAKFSEIVTEVDKAVTTPKTDPAEDDPDPNE